MRRTAALGALAVLAACATPAISLSPRYAAGEVRIYAMSAEVRTRFDLPGLRDTETTRLEATLRVEVTKADARESAVTVVLTPTGFERDGRRAEAPPEELTQVTVGADGRVRSASETAGVASGEDLATLLGATLRRGRVRLADRWRDDVAGAGGREGSRRSRLAALRFVSGYRCAIVETATDRPVERVRDAGGAQLRLTGTESSAATIAFAFDDGFPVEIVSDAQAVLEAAGLRGTGSVVVDARTEIRLRSRTPGRDG